MSGGTPTFSATHWESSSYTAPQGLVMAPLILLYFFSIGLSYIAQAGRRRKQAESEKKAREAETS